MTLEQKAEKYAYDFHIRQNETGRSKSVHEVYIDGFNDGYDESKEKLSQAKKIIMNLRNIITGDITIIDTEEKGSFFKQAVEFLKEEI